MSEIIFLVAIANNGVLGCDGRIPWHHPADIKRFKNITMGYPVVMGRKTWDSLPKQPLPGRINIVLTRNSIVDDRCLVYRDLKEVIVMFSNKEKIYVIGGAEIFKAYMDFADTLDITYINDYYNGDTFFPDVDMEKWYIYNKFNTEGLEFVKYKRKYIYKES